MGWRRFSAYSGCAQFRSSLIASSACQNVPVRLAHRWLKTSSVPLPRRRDIVPLPWRRDGLAEVLGVFWLRAIQIELDRLERLPECSSSSCASMVKDVECSVASAPRYCSVALATRWVGGGSRRILAARNSDRA